MADKFTKKYLSPGSSEADEPLELTEVVEEPSDDNYVLYGREGRASRTRRRSLIDIGALEEVALREARRLSAEFLAEHGPDIMSEEAREVMAEAAREVAPQVAQEVLRERAAEVLSQVAEQAALAAAREVVGRLAEAIIERVAREVVPRVAEEAIGREIERLKASMRQGLS